jgi:hypothetical protein
MKKSLIFLLLLSFFTLLPFLTVRADFGPKRTLDVEIFGVNEPYYIELLMKGELPIDDDLLSVQSLVNDQHEDFPDMLYTFELNGFVASSLVLPWGSSYQNPKDNYYIYPYNPPTEFKIMLIFDDGNYVVSRTINTTLFNSKVTYDLTGINFDFSQTNIGSVELVFPTQTMTLELVLRIVGTIFIEILVLFLFGYVSKKSFKLVAHVNLVTQIILTLFMFSAKYFIYPGVGEIFVLIVGEMMIFISEIVIYRFYLKEKSKNKAMVYALIANTISLLASFSVMILMTNM